MTIKEIRSLTGLSQTDFGNKYNIPMRTIQNWEGGQRKAPAYVEELLEFKVRYDLNIVKVNDITQDDIEKFKKVMNKATITIIN